jgi:hypothetical protein
MKKRLIYIFFAAITIAIGLLSRTFIDHPCIRPYLGDVLYATMSYFLWSAVLPKLKPKSIWLISIVFCFSIEFLQLYQAAWIVEIRSYKLGALILGSGFVFSDLICYVIGASMTFIFDHFYLRHRISY